MKALAAIILALPLAAASAATLTVNTTADNTIAGDSQCTLREAIANVNLATDTTGGDCAAATGASDTIAFNLAMPAKIRLARSLGQLVLQHDVSIVGPTAGTLRIGQQASDRVFEIAAGTTSLSDLTIQGGKPIDEPGGGVQVDYGATLTLTNCTLRGNRTGPNGSAFSGGDGGGISNLGILTLTNCTLRGNRAAGGGGAVFNDGMLTMTNCTLRSNRASANQYGLGGAIFNGNAMTMTNCTLRGNRASKEGGAIFNVGAGTITLTNCTLDRNRAKRTGGIFNDGGFLTFINCTLNGNRGRLAGGICPSGGGTVTLTNTIINNGTPNNCGMPSKCATSSEPPGSIVSSGHNLSSDDTCFTGGGTDLVNAAPILAPLANYGGPTDMLALCSGPGIPHASCNGASPAIDAGDDAVTGPPDNLTADQRGLPRQVGAHVDIGAYEVQ